jgi:tRNA (guanine10-N2)-dimethyltransferase
VDLARPDTELHVFATSGGLWWGRLLHAFGGRAFEARRPRTRPFWRSVALGPRKARCLVNLSGVRPGGRLLDPFCGTGAIPIEAALLGVHAHAGDLDPRVAAGAARNAAHVGVDVTLRCRDARAWGAGGRHFDAVVADLPHGRAASLLGAERGELYRMFLGATARVLTPGGLAVLMAEAGALPPPPPGLVVVGRYPEVVHSAFTREVVVLQRIPAG